MIFISTVVKWVEYKSLELKPFFLPKVTWIVWMIPSQLFSFVCELVSLTTGCQINFSALIKSKQYIPSIPKGLKSERIISSKAFVGHKSFFSLSLPCADPKERWWYWYFIKRDNANSPQLWVCAVQTVCFHTEVAQDGGQGRNKQLWFGAKADMEHFCSTGESKSLTWLLKRSYNRVVVFDLAIIWSTFYKNASSAICVLFHHNKNKVEKNPTWKTMY